MLKIINHGNVREIRLERPPVNAITLEFADHTGDSIANLVDNWFSEETQAVMKSLNAQLKAKK